MRPRMITAGVLNVSYHEYGDVSGWPCILCHGFPYDALAYGEVGRLLSDAGAWVIVPFLRGYGSTRFLSSKTLRSGEQAALGYDLLQLMDALRIERAVLGGYDWGGRAACIVAALWPGRVEALVSGSSYNIQNIEKSLEPSTAAEEAAYWYQYYFHSERGRRGLAKNRRDLTRLLWKMWSPTWNFDETIFDQTAVAFDNPDFVDVVIHSYRHRYGLVAGDPAFASIESQLAKTPDINVPTICVDGDADSVSTATRNHRKHFSGKYEYRLFSTAGHNLPQERPQEWSQAVLDVRRTAMS